jgi:hypothetical protein
MTPTRLRFVAVLVLLAGPAAAQWLTLPLPGTPRTADGKPDLTAPTPRTPDSKPDLSGIWRRVEVKRRDNPDNFNLVDWMPAGAQIRMRPEAAAVYQHRRDVQRGGGRPAERCLPHTVPDAMLPPVNFKIVYTPGITLILFEEFNHFRQIFTDGRTLPPVVQPTWWGNSVGRWEGDVFVVETTGFNDRAWLDNTGHGRSEALKTTERFRRTDFGHMEMAITIDDPETYLEPFTATVHFELLPDTELVEDICEYVRDPLPIPQK